jgi:hypothetical protein
MDELREELAAHMAICQQCSDWTFDRCARMDEILKRIVEAQQGALV